MVWLVSVYSLEASNILAIETPPYERVRERVRAGETVRGTPKADLPVDLQLQYGTPDLKDVRSE